MNYKYNVFAALFLRRIATITTTWSEPFLSTFNVSLSFFSVRPYVPADGAKLFSYPVVALLELYAGIYMAQTAATQRDFVRA